MFCCTSLSLSLSLSLLLLRCLALIVAIVSFCCFCLLTHSVLVHMLAAPALRQSCCRSPCMQVLQAAFSQFGPVQRAIVVSDASKDGCSKGSAFFVCVPLPACPLSHLSSSCSCCVLFMHALLRACAVPVRRTSVYAYVRACMCFALWSCACLCMCMHISVGPVCLCGSCIHLWYENPYLSGSLWVCMYIPVALSLPVYMRDTERNLRALRALLQIVRGRGESESAAAQGSDLALPSLQVRVCDV